MKNFIANTFKRLRRDESGATLVEYGIAIALAVVLGAGALSTLAGDVAGSMTAAGNCMPNADGSVPTCGTTP